MTTQGDAASPSPRRLIRLLQESGWEVVGGRDNAYVRFQAPGDELGARRRTLLVPVDENAGDFPELMREAINALRALPSDSAAMTLFSRLTSSPTDQFEFTKETAAPRGWIRWSEGETLIESARKLLLVGAKGARERRKYFGNRYGQFANRFLDEVMMGQTEVGSYVVRAYVPVDRAIPMRSSKDAEEGIHFVGQDALSSREVSETVVDTLNAVTEAVAHYRQYNSMSAFLSPELGISYEAVLAVKRIAENADYAGITVAWDPAEAHIQYEQEFTFQASAVPVLERAASELIIEEPARTAVGRGTVHLLTQAHHGGPGVIGVTTIDGIPARKLRVHLDADDYQRALEAHGAGQLLTVRGTLEREHNLSHLYGASVTGVSDMPADMPARRDESASEDDSPLF